jgi:hypothetical protein
MKGNEEDRGWHRDKAYAFQSVKPSYFCLPGVSSSADWLSTFLYEWILLSALVGRRIKHASF